MSRATAESARQLLLLQADQAQVPEATWRRKNLHTGQQGTTLNEMLVARQRILTQARLVDPQLELLLRDEGQCVRLNEKQGPFTALAITQDDRQLIFTALPARKDDSKSGPGPLTQLVVTPQGPRQQTVDSLKAVRLAGVTAADFPRGEGPTLLDRTYDWEALDHLAEQAAVLDHTGDWKETNLLGALSLGAAAVTLAVQPPTWMVVLILLPLALVAQTRPMTARREPDSLPAPAPLWTAAAGGLGVSVMLIDLILRNPAVNTLSITEPLAFVVLLAIVLLGLMPAALVYTAVNENNAETRRVHRLDQHLSQPKGELKRTPLALRPWEGPARGAALEQVCQEAARLGQALERQDDPLLSDQGRALVEELNRLGEGRHRWTRPNEPFDTVLTAHLQEQVRQAQGAHDRTLQEESPMPIERGF